jgi:riboflavin kinase/FMN adenylyltransferase
LETIYLNSGNLAYWQKKSLPNVIALGFFDGIHRGHQEVIEAAARKAKEKKLPLAVMSFFPHPKTVLSNGSVRFEYLMPITEKAIVLEGLGVDIFYIVDFDRSFAALSPTQYISQYLIDFGVVHAVAGYDFAYGSKCSARIDTMKEDSGGAIEITKVSCVDYRGRKISSTWVREALSEGNVEELPNLMGRRYELKCKWDGFSLQPMPHYTMPAPGHYSVVINNGMELESVNVVVPADKECIYLSQKTKMDLSACRSISVLWHSRIRVVKEKFA